MEMMGEVMKMNEVITIPKLLGPEYMHIPLDKAGFEHIFATFQWSQHASELENRRTPMIYMCLVHILQHKSHITWIIHL